MAWVRMELAIPGAEVDVVGVVDQPKVFGVVQMRELGCSGSS